MTFPATLKASLLSDGTIGNSRMVLIRDLMLAANIGMYDHEHGHSQTVRINIALQVDDLPVTDDSMKNVVCYDSIVQEVKAVIDQGHVGLVEVLAEKIATLCLERDLVQEAQIRVEKLDAIPETDAVGIEIVRRRPGNGLIHQTVTG